jgi:hypothetical protein
VQNERDTCNKDPQVYVHTHLEIPESLLEKILYVSIAISYETALTIDVE